MAESPGGEIRQPGGAAPSSGLSPNVAAGLSYLFLLIGGIVFILIEKEDRYVRFHAMQSILLGAAWIVLQIALNVIEAIFAATNVLGFLVVIIGLLVSLVLGLGFFILWIILVIRAFQGQGIRLPYLAPLADQYSQPGRI